MTKARTIPHSATTESFLRLTSLAVVSLDAATQAARALRFSVETKAIRIRFDSTNPTANTGILFTTTSSPYYINDFNGADLKIKGVGGTAVINIQGFKFGP